MSIHISAEKGEIAEKILLPGDPLRAKFIAENFLKDAVCYNEVRGMYGYTGTYKGERISVQGTGMGIPSMCIYAHELICDYGVKNLIRIGTCGSMQKHIKIRDVILALGASTDSNFNKLAFPGMSFAPTASFKLISKANEIALKESIPVNVGNIITSDTFYQDDADFWKPWAKYGILAVEMETAGLYTLASKFSVDALSIITVSDSVISGEQTSSSDRQNTFQDMMKIALETLISA